MLGLTWATNYHANYPHMFLKQRLYFQSRVCDVIPNTYVAMKHGAKTSTTLTVMRYTATVRSTLHTDEFRACSLVRGLC